MAEADAEAERALCAAAEPERPPLELEVTAREVTWASDAPGSWGRQLDGGEAMPGQRWRVLGTCGMALALALTAALCAAGMAHGTRFERGMGDFIRKSLAASGEESVPVTAQIAWAQHPEYCLSVANKDNQYGKLVQLSKCSGFKERFIVDLSDGGGLIRAETYPNDCFNAPTADRAGAVQLQIWPCVEVKVRSHLIFKWGITNPAQIHLQFNPARCINVPNVSSLDGATLNLGDCGPDSNPADWDTFNLLAESHSTAAEGPTVAAGPSTTTGARDKIALISASDAEKWLEEEGGMTVVTTTSTAQESNPPPFFLHGLFR